LGHGPQVFVDSATWGCGIWVDMGVNGSGQHGRCFLLLFGWLQGQGELVFLRHGAVEREPERLNG
jgi:hypothetical protein